MKARGNRREQVKTKEIIRRQAERSKENNSQKLLENGGKKGSRRKIWGKGN